MIAQTICLYLPRPKRKFLPPFRTSFSRFQRSSDCWFSIKSSMYSKIIQIKKKNKKKKTNKFLCLFSSKKRCRLRSSHAGAHRYNSVNRLSLVFIQKVQLPLFSFLIYWGTTTTTTRNNNNTQQSAISFNCESLTRRRHDILFKPLRPKLTANPIEKRKQSAFGFITWIVDAIDFLACRK